MASLTVLKPKSVSQKATRTVMDTILVTPEICNSWLAPVGQRPVRENEKVRALTEKLKLDGGVWPGVVTLGVLEKLIYLLDGQHRRYSFLSSGLKEGYVDIRILYCNSMAEMGEEFVELNSRLVSLRPDDILRALEGSMAPLQIIRKKCPFVGYDMVRRGPKSPVVSMSSMLRCWKAALPDIPSYGGGSARDLAEAITEDDARTLCEFLALAVEAFGRDEEYQRLWTGLNLTLCMWLYRRLVLSRFSARIKQLTRDDFRKCLIGLSANIRYIEWLADRRLTNRDRSPAYGRIKGIFGHVLAEQAGHKVVLPSPAWSND